MEEKTEEITVRFLEEKSEEEVQESVMVVKKVFDEFVGSSFTEEGRKRFHEDLIPDSLMKKSGCFTIVAIFQKEVIGVAKFTPPKTKLTLFFVRKDMMGKGVGKRMFKMGLLEMKRIKKKENEKFDGIFVNSSKFAVPVYEKLGFKHTTGRQENNGFVFYPMFLKF